jgi:uncharacterized protein (TIGR03435 family)
MAFDTREQISGGPAWIDSEKFDIVAKEDKDVMAQLHQLSPGQKGEEYRSMIQALLSDRFKLSSQRETKELTTYTLLLAKGGPKLKPSVLDPKLPARNRWTVISFVSGFGDRCSRVGSYSRPDAWPSCRNSNASCLPV